MLTPLLSALPRTVPGARTRADSAALRIARLASCLAGCRLPRWLPRWHCPLRGTGVRQSGFARRRRPRLRRLLPRRRFAPLVQAAVPHLANGRGDAALAAAPLNSNEIRLAGSSSPAQPSKLLSRLLASAFVQRVRRGEAALLVHLVLLGLLLQLHLVVLVLLGRRSPAGAQPHRRHHKCTNQAQSPWYLQQPWCGRGLVLGATPVHHTKLEVLADEELPLSTTWTDEVGMVSRSASRSLTMGVPSLLAGQTLHLLAHRSIVPEHTWADEVGMV